MAKRLQSGNNARGFTLIELAVVVLIIGLIGAVVFPQFLPLLAFSQLEGTARRLGNFGRGAIAQATLLRQDVTVRIDLDNQEFYAVRWYLPSDEETEGEPEEDYFEKFRDFRLGSEFSPSELSDMLASGDLEQMMGDFDAEMADMQLNDRFARWHRSITLSRAENVEHDEGMLSDVGNFSEKFSFSLEEEEEPIEEEIYDPALERSSPLGEVYIEQVVIDGESVSGGVAEVELSALGLLNDVWLYVTDGAEYYTIHWDPVLGISNVMRGKY